ncbi:class I SAM-dependent methyltransferase [Brassicibacter mesophilus]|uniref:tRNA (mnm(5)s(2)U34)-methyltransferase n=1 Tax=Brassicibacter mesophilus TaxID=745119 RepID=UPI003D1CBA73
MNSLVKDAVEKELRQLFKFFTNATTIARHIMSCKISKGNIAIDATVGNGNDTVFIAELVGDKGKVYGFDVQKTAMDNTINRLTDIQLDNRVVLINDGHEKIDTYIHEKIDFIVFNLGYLPKGDHNIVTKSDTTIIALSKSLDVLKKNGIILITAYPGHKEGKKEKKDIDSFISKLNQKEFAVLKFEFMNQINDPPILYGIEKK